jgi:hypothetical protein
VFFFGNCEYVNKMDLKNRTHTCHFPPSKMVSGENIERNLISNAVINGPVATSPNIAKYGREPMWASEHC